MMLNNAITCDKNYPRCRRMMHTCTSLTASSPSAVVWEEMSSGKLLPSLGSLNCDVKTRDEIFLSDPFRIFENSRWEDIYKIFGNSLDKSTIIQQYHNSTAARDCIADGYRALWSREGLWYLDHLDVTWQDMYLAVGR